VDGVRQKVASSLDGSNDSGGITVDPAQIERIEVIKGPASALYGSDAIGGVVNIITKKHMDKPFGFSAGVAYDGSRNGFSPEAMVYGSVGGFYVKGSGMVIENKDLSLPGGHKFHHSESHTEIYNLRTGYQWERADFDLNFMRSDGWRNMAATQSIGSKTYQISPDFLAANNHPRYSRVPKAVQQQAVGTLTLNDLSGVLERLVIQAYLTDSQVDIDFNGVTITPAGLYDGPYVVFSQDSAKGFGGSVQADFDLPLNNRLTVGFDYDRNRIHSTGVYGGLYQARGILDEDRQGESTNYAFFAQNEWRPVLALGITGGLRYSVMENKLTRDRAFPQRTAGTRESNIVGSLGVVFDVSEALSLRALYSQGFRAPNLTQQMLGGSQRFMPNLDLKPERSNNYELGVRYADYGLNVDLAFFHSDLKDAFYDHTTDVPNPNGNFYLQTRNSDRASATGAELEASYEIETAGLTPFLSMTVMRYERQFSNGFKTEHTGVPHTWGTGGLRYSKDIGDNMRLFGEGALTWSGGFFDESATGRNARTLIYNQGLKGDVTLGLEGGDEHRYRATLSFRNIGDNEFQPWGYFQPGFHVVAAVGYQY
jgi:hemoglobin/transferrin/lactoferrin receptor protein